MKLELRHLRYFLAVAEELHFGRAAERLHIAQPPLSVQVRALEAIVGAPLFYRMQRRVLLTKAGEVLVQEARHLLARASGAIEAARSASRGEIGELAIGFVSTADYNVLPSLLRELRARAPRLRLGLRELTTDVQIRALSDRTIDAGFVMPPVDNPELEYRPVHREPLLVALHENHPLARHAAPIRLADLAGEPFLLFPRQLGPRLYDDIVSFCQRCGFSPRVEQEAVQMQTIISLVSAGIGVALIPASLTNLGRTGVVYKTTVEEAPLTELGVAWRRGECLDTVRLLLELVSTVAPMALHND
ncbi:MAG: LysR family transcriptional regulator [Betaproteobacteria bacterium]